MPKKKLEYRIVELNNKSRKGKYIYLRKKGKSHYYKIIPGMSVKKIISFRTKPQNKHKNIKTKKPTKKTTPQKRVEINKIIKKGITTQEIYKPHKKNSIQLNKIKHELLKPLIGSKTHLKNMVQDQNFNKIKRRLEYKISLIDKTGQIIGTATKMNITLNTAIKDIKESITEGEETALFETSPTINKLKKKGWQVKTIDNGRIANIKLRIIFRKNK